MMLLLCIFTAILNVNLCLFIYPSWRTSGSEKDEQRKVPEAVCQRRWGSLMISYPRFAQVKSSTRTLNLNATASALSTSWQIVGVVKDQSPRRTTDLSEYSQKEFGFLYLQTDRELFWNATHCPLFSFLLRPVITDKLKDGQAHCKIVWFIHRCEGCPAVWQAVLTFIHSQDMNSWNQQFSFD